MSYYNFEKNLKWIMPEKRDEVFSNELLSRLKILAEALNVEEFIITISEQYEEEDTPHYWLRKHIATNSQKRGILNTCTAMRIDYSATTDEEEYKGKIYIMFESEDSSLINQILGSGIFFLYDEEIRKHYSEWETIYDDIQGFNKVI